MSGYVKIIGWPIFPSYVDPAIRSANLIHLEKGG